MKNKQKYKSAFLGSRYERIFFCFLIISFSTISAQKRKALQGKLTSSGNDVQAVHVQNVTTKRATITGVNGYFTIRASVKDTIAISAIQFKKKVIIVTRAMLQSSLMQIPLEDALTELDEVVVMPYNLSGDISKDLNILKTEPVVTASTLGLPNSYIEEISMAERKLYAARTWDFTGASIRLDPIMNYFSGRTKMLNNRVKRNMEYGRTQRVRAFYADSVFIIDLKISKEKIEDFMYFCEVDANFQAIVDSQDYLKLWGYLERRSKIYRENNGLE